MSYACSMSSVGVSPHDELFIELLGQTCIKICLKINGRRVTKVYSYRKINKLTHNCFSIMYIAVSNKELENNIVDFIHLCYIGLLYYKRPLLFVGVKRTM